ncbi:MAG TPA: hypothetical protein DHV48_03680 [Prolixibacteraceae bacterium]|nr:hypothetical protein [Prolixibacteraceae bacterium]
MNITQDSFGGRNVVFDSVLEDIPGGLSLDKTRIPATLLYVGAGAPVNVNKTTRVAELIKTAVCVADSASGDAVRVAKGHLFAAADVITDGYVVCAITSIDTSNAAYDIIVPATTFVNYAEGTVIVESATGKVAGTHAAVTVTIASGKTITVNDPSGKAAGIIVSIAAAGDDNLACSFAGKTLTIALASTTASKNTPAVEVQAAIRALVTPAFDFSAFVVTGDELAGSGVTPATGVMAVNNPYKYEANGLVKSTVNVEGANADCSVVLKGAVRESALPYPVSPLMKATLSGITFNA